MTTTPELRTDVVDGRYSIHVFDKSVPAASFAQLATATDGVTVLAAVSDVSDPFNVFAVGLACTNGEGKGYQFFANLLGGYSIVKNQRLLRFVPPSLDELEPRTIRSLRLVCDSRRGRATKIYAAINQGTVATVRDKKGQESFTHIALLVDVLVPRSFARFDNVVARVPQPREVGPG
jgi:hypothetical protein